MVRPKPKPVSNVREFFSEELRATMDRHRLHVENDSFEYVVNLLVHYMESDKFFTKDEQGNLKNNYLYELYTQYLSGDTEVKRLALRRLGDICLLVTGFFPDSLNRKMVDVDYYLGMGGTAYHHLAGLQYHSMARSLYGELSAKFRSFADVLGEISSRAGMQTNTDILRIYEKWLLTGSDRLKNLLGEKGIVGPVVVDWKVRH